MPDARQPGSLQPVESFIMRVQPPDDLAELRLLGWFGAGLFHHGSSSQSRIRFGVPIEYQWPPSRVSLFSGQQQYFQLRAYQPRQMGHHQAQMHQTLLPNLEGSVLWLLNFIPFAPHPGRVGLILSIHGLFR